MAKADMSSWDGFIGRVGDTVTYIRNGVLIKRKIGKSTKKATTSQRKHRQRLKITNQFISPVKEFIQFGLMAEAKALKKTPNDLMLSYTINAIEAESRKQKIDFTKIIFSKGSIKDTPGLKVQLNEGGLEFSWDTKTSAKNQSRNDDWMMAMVYFPEQYKADFSTQAARRVAGKFQFNLLRNEKPAVMEIFVSFMSSDQKRISNSAYLGQLILPAYDQ